MVSALRLHMAFARMSKGVIFDIDGTLVDSVDLHAQAWQDALAHFGYDVAFQDIRQQIGKGGDQLLPVFVPPEDFARRGEEILEWRSEHFKERYLPRVRAFPKVRELFERIRADGKKIALASSAKGHELATYKRVARIEGMVEGETSADDVERSKPHPDIFVAAIESLDGIERQDLIAVGDSPYDPEAAGKAGVRTVGVLCGGFGEETLRRAGCFAIYRDPAHLLQAYDESPLARTA